MDGYLVAFAVVAAYFTILTVGWRYGYWKKSSVSLYGPVLLWRTRRGRKTMERAASRRRLWRTYGVIAIWFCLVSMSLLMLLLIWDTYGVLTAQGSPEDPEISLAPLGIDTLVLAVYFVFGLTLAVAAHEYFHGIQVFSEKIRLDYIGIVFLVIPIGAFVEPRDEELKAASESKRMRVFASGPATNVLIAIICIGILSGVLGPSIEPREEGVLITAVAGGSPADKFGLPIWSEICQVQATPVRTSADMASYWFDSPGDEVAVQSIYKGVKRVLQVPSGVVVTAVYEGPGFSAGLEPGMIIAELNGTTIHSVDILRSVTENSTHKAPIDIRVLRYGYDPSRGRDWFVEDPSIKQVNLTSKWLFYYKYYPSSANKDEYRNLSIMGVSTSPFGVGIENMDYLPQLVTHPLGESTESKGPVVGLLRFVALPALGYSPVVSPATELYVPSGVFAGVPSDMYWVIINICYWLFWANLILGIANALPALPFDGGYVLRDALKRIAHLRAIRISGLDRALGKKSIADRDIDLVMWIVSGAVYVLLVILLTWQVIGPIF